ncbi:MAG: hypothetical protein EOP83_02775 [Verrucomicrobiaceae bacterium]|nr:MAG: hypothetical protein EOP83_02775 [Verrucomicrobiaceae bacterium]
MDDLRFRERRPKNQFCIFVLRSPGIAETSIEQIDAFIEEVEAWCGETFPDRGETRWTNRGWTFRIYDEDDAFAFKMRWC